MKMRINKHDFPKEESLSSDFLDLLERIKCKGSKKCNENDQRRGTGGTQARTLQD